MCFLYEKHFDSEISNYRINIKKKKNPCLWWGSNSRPLDLKSSMLTIALRRFLLINKDAISEFQVRKNAIIQEIFHRLP
jgi:hypothetical protein